MFNVAHILETPINSPGGLNVLALQLATGLSEYFNSYIFCPKHARSNASNISPKAPIIHLPWSEKATRQEILSYLKCEIRRRRIDVLIFHGGDFAMGPNRRRVSMVNILSFPGIVSIYVNHQSTPLNFYLPTLNMPARISVLKSLPRFAISWFFKMLQISSTNMEVTVSHYEEKCAKRRYWFFKKKIAQIYHSRLSEIYALTYKPPEKKNIILNVGHFAYRKGQHVLLKAFGRISARYPDWNLQLVGFSIKDDYWHFLRKIIEEYGISTQVALLPSAENPDEYFKGASIYVQPSLVEAYGLALQEAMFFGCATIGSNIGGIPESVTSADCLFPVENDYILSKILNRMVGNSHLMKECQHSARNEALRSNRTREQMIIQYRHLIEKCLNQQK